MPQNLSEAPRSLIWPLLSKFRVGFVFPRKRFWSYQGNFQWSPTVACDGMSPDSESQWGGYGPPLLRLRCSKYSPHLSDYRSITLSSGLVNRLAWQLVVAPRRPSKTRLYGVEVWARRRFANPGAPEERTWAAPPRQRCFEFLRNRSVLCLYFTNSRFVEAHSTL